MNTFDEVMEDLKKLIGKEYGVDSLNDMGEDIIQAFGDFENEDGELNVIVNESNNSNYDMIAYVDKPDSTQFLFNTKNIYDKNGIKIAEKITGIWNYLCRVERLL